MTRQTWVVGNWKQNGLREEARTRATAVARGVARAASTVHVGIAPPYLVLETMGQVCRPQGPLWLFAQDSAAQDEGAWTGEVGPAMLAEAGIHGAILGHSERRAYFGDTDALIAQKLAFNLEAGLHCILCVGESLTQRERGEHKTTVISQLSTALEQVLVESHLGQLVLAYEPVWAIGTGRTASPPQAAEMHATVREWLTERFGPAGADRSILYGGSVKPDNAPDLLATGAIDGFLVGGASLDPQAFIAIVKAAAQ